MRAKAAYLLVLVGVGVSFYFLGRTQESPRPVRRTTERVSPPTEEATDEARTRPPPEGTFRVGNTSMRVKITRPDASAGEGSNPLPVGVIAGRVHLPEGASAYGTKVRLTGQGRNLETETDALGQFRFEGLPPGPYELRAEQPGLPPRRVRLQLGDSRGAGTFDIQLGNLGSLRVQVVDESGTPIKEEPIAIASQGDQTEVAKGRTGEAGALLVENLAPGLYEVRRGRAVRVATVVPGKVVDVVFEMSAGIHGSVRGPDGKPLVNAVVRLTPVDFGSGGYRRVQARTDREGRYQMEGFPAGDYDVTIQMVGRENYVAPCGTVEVPAGRNVEHLIEVQGHSLSGRVTRKDSGAPLGERSVQITATPIEIAGDGVQKRSGQGSMAFADEGGYYRFAGLPPGTYEIWIASFDPSLRDAKRTVDFSGGAMENVDFALECVPVGVLRLRVLEPDGSPAKGLSFGLIQGRESRTLHGEAVADGLYEFRIEAGARDVSVYREGFASEVLYVTIEEGKTVEAEVQLREKEPE